MKLVPLVLAVAASAFLATTGISAPRDTTFPGGSYFAIICSFSHRIEPNNVLDWRTAGPAGRDGFAHNGRWTWDAS